MAQNLSKDLPDNFSSVDILGEDETPEETLEEILGNDLDIMPDDSEETSGETEEETQEENKDETKNEEEISDKTGVEDLASVEKEGDEIKEGLNEAAKTAEEMKGTIEEVKEAIENDNTDAVEELIDELYKQVIDYSAKNDAITMKNEVLQEKMMELSKKLANYELEMAQTPQKSSDPKMLILNRMYDGAKSGEEFSKNKVIATLEDMYYGLTGKTFEEKRVEDTSNSNANGMVLNEMTSPSVEEETTKQPDLNDITSIF